MQIDDPTAALPRRERERHMRRSEMLRAARQLLAEKGFAGATLEEIAHRAEFGKGTLYNYFPGGKEEILFAVVEDLYDDLCRVVDEAFVDDGLPIDRSRFQSFITVCLGHFDERRELFLILMKEAHRMGFSDDPDRVRFFLRQREKVAQALARPIRRAVESGTMRPLPPEAVAHMLLGNIQGCQMHLALQDRDGRCDSRSWSVTDAASFLTVMLFDGLLTDSVRTNQASSAGSDVHASK